MPRPEEDRPPEDLTPEERLRIDNELKKAQLADQFGALFADGPDGGLPPEMEAEFLARIQAVESGGAETYVPIRSLLSKRTLKQTAAKAEQGRHEEAIGELLAALLDAGVITEQPTWITDRAYYKFLVTDFLDHTIPEPPPLAPGAETRHAIGVLYDQVRSDSPNHMATVTELFLEDLLDVEQPFEGHLLAHTCRDGEEVVPKAVALEKIRRWKAQWTDIRPLAFGTGKPVRGPDGAVYFQFGCAYGVTDRHGNTEEYDGPGLSQLALEEGEFRVVGWVMEGFEM